MRIIISTLLFMVANILAAQDIIYNKADSLFITNILNKYATRCNEKELMLAVAGEFIGHKYTAGTLEKGEGEPLIINTAEVDCTTFVELALALYVSIREGEKSFSGLCSNLEKIRYRKGTRKGYASRLHYISQWIADSAKQHIIKESTNCAYSKKQLLNLNFMSNHPASYKQLQEAPSLIAEIKKHEEPFRGLTVEYIPKEELARTSKELPIKNGDIIALTTSIEGLDVVHTGVAFWQEGKLHLLHASSAEGKVIKDTRSLYDYQKNKKKQTGIRVFSIIK